MTDPADGLASALAGWEGLAMVVRRDAPTGAWIFVALHDDTLGPCAGGTRMRAYPYPAEGARDAARLAEGMTHKWAVHDLPFGGGKAVLALEHPLSADARRGLLLRYADLLESLGGTFGTGEDLGTTPDDMALLATRTRHVVGLDPAGQGPRDPGPFTALGVFEGMRAAVARARGSADLSGVRVLVQGAGDVGAPLLRLLGDAGARPAVADVDPGRAARCAEEVGAETVPAEAAYEYPCDVFAPCAVGGVLNAETIPRLRCAVVAGSANNQLATAADGERLQRRGILYAPDYVVNGGGAVAFGLLHLGVRDPEELAARVRTIGRTVGEVLDEAASGGITPPEAALRRVRRVLRRGPPEPRSANVL